MSSSSIPTMRTLVDFPSDVLSHVFTHLDGYSLIQCSEVSRFFAHTISYDGTLQYQLALYKSGLVDDPLALDSLSVSERRQHIQKLSDARSAWAIKGPTSIIQLPASSPQRVLYWEYNAGLVSTLPTMRSFRCADILTAPGLTNEVEFALDGIQGFYTDHHIDRHQDLLLVGALHSNVHTAEGANIHFFSLSTGKPHPEASKACINLKHYGGNFACLYMEIQNNFVFCAEIVDGMFWPAQSAIYNWKSGELVSHFKDGPNLGMTFLGQDYLIGCSLKHDNSSIELSIYSVKASQRVLTLRLPQMVHMDGSPSDFESEPLSHHRKLSLPAPSQRQRPFYTSPDHTVISLVMQYRDTWGFACVFPQADILELVKRHEGTPNTIIEWGTWPQCTFTLPYDVACSSYGSRLAISDLGSKQVKVYDFHPRWFARDMTTVQYGKIFTAPFKTILPPEPSQVLSVSLTPDRGSVILDENALIVISPERQNFKYYVYKT